MYFNYHLNEITLSRYNRGASKVTYLIWPILYFRTVYLWKVTHTVSTATATLARTMVLYSPDRVLPRARISWKADRWPVEVYQFRISLSFSPLQLPPVAALSFPLFFYFLCCWSSSVFVASKFPLWYSVTLIFCYIYVARDATSQSLWVAAIPPGMYLRADKMMVVRCLHRSQCCPHS